MHARLAAAAGFTLTALWSVAASAHSRSPEATPGPPLASASAVGFASSHAAAGAVVLVVAALLFTAIRGRKALGTALVALALWSSFQVATHSVHHLGQPSEAARCAVASSAAQASAILAARDDSVSILLVHIALALGLDAVPHPCGLLSTHEGRAPPRLAL